MPDFKDISSQFLKLRELDSERLVQGCEEWLGNQPTWRDLFENERISYDQIGKMVRAYRAVDTQVARLLAAEDLADIIVELIDARHLSTRTPPSDAVENFYDLGLGRSCDRCKKRLRVITPSDQGLCVHCRLEASGEVGHGPV